MTKLYIVIYLAGLIGGYAGPLPFDDDKCESIVAELHTQCKENPASAYRCSEVRFKCERRDGHPPIDPRAGKRAHSETEKR